MILLLVDNLELSFKFVFFLKMARHLKSRYEILRASNDSRGLALHQAQKVHKELLERFEKTEMSKRHLENHLLELEEQLAKSALANAQLHQQVKKKLLFIIHQ